VGTPLATFNSFVQSHKCQVLLSEFLNQFLLRTSNIPSVHPPCPCWRDCTISKSRSMFTLSFNWNSVTGKLLCPLSWPIRQKSCYTTQSERECSYKNTQNVLIAYFCVWWNGFFLEVKCTNRRRKDKTKAFEGSGTYENCKLLLFVKLLHTCGIASCFYSQETGSLFEVTVTNSLHEYKIFT